MSVSLRHTHTPDTVTWSKSVNLYTIALPSPAPCGWLELSAVSCSLSTTWLCMPCRTQPRTSPAGSACLARGGLKRVRSCARAPVRSDTQWPWRAYTLNELNTIYKKTTKYYLKDAPRHGQGNIVVQTPIFLRFLWNKDMPHNELRAHELSQETVSNMHERLRNLFTITHSPVWKKHVLYIMTVSKDVRLHHNNKEWNVWTHM